MKLLKSSLPLLVLFFTLITYSQNTDFNSNKGFVAEGYDVVAYFDGKAIEGKDNLVFEHSGVKFKFSSMENLEAFKANPNKFIPQYGGYCAWAIADKGEKVNIDPESFEIRDGKLYLFYDSIFSNTLKKWKKNNPEQLSAEADRIWEKIKHKEN